MNDGSAVAVYPSAPEYPLSRQVLGQSGHAADIAKTTFMTHCGYPPLHHSLGFSAGATAAPAV